MIFTPQNTKGKKVVVKDELGGEIATCFEYNTKTRTAKCYVVARRNKKGMGKLIISEGEAVTVKLKLPGSCIIVDGKRY